LRPQDIQKLCSEARKMLLQWKDSYFKVRAKIEASGRDSRWEFDRRKLFDKTDHQALICNELIKISVVLEEFYNIFGPELKAVTGEPKRIEEVLNRVRNLIVKVKSVSYSILIKQALLFNKCFICFRFNSIYFRLKISYHGNV
jgi:dynein heavy chain